MKRSRWSFMLLGLASLMVLATAFSGVAQTNAKSDDQTVAVDAPPPMPAAAVCHLAVADDSPALLPADAVIQAVPVVALAPQPAAADSNVQQQAQAPLATNAGDQAVPVVSLVPVPAAADNNVQQPAQAPTPTNDNPAQVGDQPVAVGGQPVVAGSQPAVAGAVPVAGAPAVFYDATIGLTLEALPKLGGLKIVAIVPGSFADRARLKPGDVIVRVNGREMFTPADFIQSLNLSHGHAMIWLQDVRSGRLVMNRAYFPIASAVKTQPIRTGRGYGYSRCGY